ncbi:hypothetical protein KDH_63090 [Dictyobacter sp. S3.2.2.5]|uniref:FHA domain-containing protein n=1 Tax=Dictyobacter halimunensis TaxID=3026934 RepID=A0ABQ6G0P4_9CHLR|nr:hypothetical protein KDH_63090 [Dictyobacter sp. S3.2.2.5]
MLRVVRVLLPADPAGHPDTHPRGLFPEERLVYVLTSRETTIGRALSNDLILMDPSVSREHARLIFDGENWSIHNITEQNILHVNGHEVTAGARHALKSQDFLVLGNTMLQLIAPKGDQDVSIASVVDDEEAGELPLPTPSQISDEAVKFPVSSTTPHPRVFSRLPLLPPIKKTPATNGKRHEAHTISPETANLKDHQTVMDLDARAWAEEGKLLGSSITLQFAFPRVLKKTLRWTIGGLLLLALLLSALAAIILNNLLGIVSLVQESPVNILSVLTIPIVAALGINLLVNFIDRYEREPWFLRLAAFLWGAIIAIPPTTFIEGSIDSWRSAILGPQAGRALHALFSALNAGITEETVKGLGLLLLFFVLRDEFDNVTDGIVYGALIGAGFAMVENIFYFAGNPKAFLFLLIGRIVLGWLSHSTFTICLGIALGYMRHTQIRWRQIMIPIIGYFIAVGLHTAFDFINFFANALVLSSPDNSNIVMFSLFASIGDYILPFIAQMVIIYCLIKSLAHEAAIIREFLASEVSNGIVTVDEYAMLQHSFLRTRIERGILFRQGFKQWMRVKALYQTEIGLAFRKWHVSMGDKPKLGYIQPEDAYRQRIQRLRQDIILAEVPNYKL